MKAEELYRERELKIGPSANAIERRAQLVAGAEGRGYDPLTQRGARVRALRQAKVMFAEMRERLELTREAWPDAREEGQGHVSAGLAALRAAAGRQPKELDPKEIKERLAWIAGRGQGEGHDQEPGQSDQTSARPCVSGDIARRLLAGLGVRFPRSEEVATSKVHLLA